MGFDTGQQLVDITSSACCERNGGKRGPIGTGGGLPVVKCVLDSRVIDDPNNITNGDIPIGDFNTNLGDCTFNETNPDSQFEVYSSYSEELFPPLSNGSTVTKQYPIIIQNAPCPDTSGGSIPPTKASQFKLVVTDAPVTVKMEAFGGNASFTGNECVYQPTGNPLFYTLLDAGEQIGTSFTTTIYGEGGTADSIGQIGGLTPLGFTDRYCFRITELRV